MAYSLEEFGVVAIVGITILVLTLFFGIFWALLLVFTFLWLLYKFGRPRRTKKTTKTTTITYKTELPVDMDDTEYTDRGMDVPFTGLPSPKVRSIRSPMPLLSTVTKRLSFNASSFSPRNNCTTSRRSFGSPVASMSQQSPRHFSLINSKFQQQPTIKIAPFDNRILHVQEEVMESMANPLSRTTILCALKQSTARKRTAYEDEEIDAVVIQSENKKKKRRYNYPNTPEVDSPMNKTTVDLDVAQEILVNPPHVIRMAGINSLIQTRLRRRPLHGTDDDSDDIKQALTKKTRSSAETDNRLPQVKEYESKLSSKDVRVVEQVEIDSNGEYSRSTSPVHSAGISTAVTKTSFDKNDGDSDSGCDADDDDDIIMKTIPLNSEKPSERCVALEENNRTKRPRDEPCNQTPTKRVSKKQMLSMKQTSTPRTPCTPCAIEVTSNLSKHSSSNSTCTSSPGQTTTPKKRFTIIRFPSKNSEAKRRPVPVYCASVNSPDLPKRQPTTHKITKQDIELDRKLAWQRIQSFLDASDEEDDKEVSVTSPSVALNVVTCLASPSRSITSTTITGGLSSISQALSTTTSQESLQSAVISTALTTGTIPSLVATQPTSVQSQPLQNPTTSLTMLSPPTKTDLPSTSREAASAISLGITPIATTAQSTNISTSTLVTELGKTSDSSGISLANPLKGLVGTSATSVNPAFLTSTTTPSQSLQTPICTPVIQTTFGLKTTNATPAPIAAPAPISLQFGSGASGPSQGQSTNPTLGGSTVANPLLGGSYPLTGGGSTVTNPLLGGSYPLTGGGSTVANPLLGGSYPLTGGGSTVTNPLLGGSHPLIGGSNTTNQTQGFSVPNVVKPVGTSLFAGLSGSLASAYKKPLGGSMGGGFDIHASTTTTGIGNTFGFGATTTDQTIPGSFGAKPQPVQNMPTFGSSGASPASNIFGSSTGPVVGGMAASQHSVGGPSQSGFGTSAIPQSGFNSSSATTKSAFAQNPNPAEITNLQAKPQAQPSFAFGASAAPQASVITSTSSVFGASTAKNVFGTTAGTQSPFGAATTQKAFRSPAIPISTQNPFGSPTVTKTNHNAFGSPAATKTIQNAFGSPAATKMTHNAFGSAGSAPKPAFGSQTPQSAFGKTATSGVFGASTTHNAFGTQPRSQNSTGGFGFSGSKTSTATVPNSTGGFGFSGSITSSTAAAPSSTGGFGAGSTSGAPISGGFNFRDGRTSTSTGGFAFGSGGPNTTTAIASNAGGFSFSTASNNTTTGTPKPAAGFGFGSGSSIPTTGGMSSAGGFNFGSGGAAPNTGGFGFGGAATTGGFQFGAMGGAQQNFQNVAPTFGGGSPAPTGGFNFGGGSAAPTFGAPSNNAGPFAFGSGAQTLSSAVAKARPKVQARRRTRKQP